MATPIQFGILLVPFQLVDAAMPLDILNSCSVEYLRDFNRADIADQGIHIQVHHIGPTMEPVTHSGSFRSLPTCTVHTCPKLDYLLIGGPAPDYIMTMPEEVKTFIRERSKDVKTVFTTCTGGMVVAATGILDGLAATTNHGAIPLAEKMFPAVKWTKERQWVEAEDGKAKFVTAGGAAAGMDMMAHWVMERYGMEVAKAGFVALDYQPRDVQRRMVKLGGGLDGELVSHVNSH